MDGREQIRSGVRPEFVSDLRETRVGSHSGLGFGWQLDQGIASDSSDEVLVDPDEVYDHAGQSVGRALE